MGYDPYLDDAIKAVIDETKEWEESEDEDGYYEEDED
jgi:hypothetical protein